MKKSFVFLLIAFLAIGLMVSCQPDQEVKQVARLVFFDEGTRGYDSLTGATLNWDADDFYWSFSVSMPQDWDGSLNEGAGGWKNITQPSGITEEPGDGEEVEIPATTSGSSTLALTSGDLEFFVGDIWDFHIVGYATEERDGDPIFEADIERVVMENTTPINATVELTDEGKAYFADGNGSIGFEKLVYTGASTITENTNAIVSVTVGSTTGYVTGKFDNQHKLTISTNNNIAKVAESFEDNILELGSNTNIFTASADSQEVKIKVFVEDAGKTDGEIMYDADADGSASSYSLVAWCEPLDAEIFVYNEITTWIDCAFSGTGKIERTAKVSALTFTVTMPTSGGFVNLTDADFSVKSIVLDSKTSLESITLTMSALNPDLEGKYANLCEIELNDGKIFTLPYSGYSIGDTGTVADPIVNPITSTNKDNLVIVLDATKGDNSPFEDKTEHNQFLTAIVGENVTATVKVSFFSDSEGVNKIAQYVSPAVAITPPTP